jgi:hypothetical protein
VYEDECTKCQCIENNYKCVKVPCLPPGNSRLETTTLREDIVTIENMIRPTTDSKTCDYWSQWFNEHDPSTDPFEREGKSSLELYNIGFCENVRSL